jgi:hypothetical protein
MKAFFTIISLLLISLNANAGLTKWVDADGKVHYSDTPPPEVETKNVKDFSGKGKADAPSGYTPKSYVEREAELRKEKQSKDEAAQKKAQQDAQAENKKRNCEAARENLRTLDAGGRIANYDANGERSYLDDDARAQRREEANKAISANCN